MSIAVTLFETPILEPAAWIASEKPATIEARCSHSGPRRGGNKGVATSGGCGGIVVRSWYCSSVGQPRHALAPTGWCIRRC